MVLTKYLYKTELFEADGETVLAGGVLTSPNALTLTVGDVANSLPTGVDQTTSIPIRATGTRNYGIIARHLVLARVVTSGSVVQRIYRKVIIFDPAQYYQMLSLFAPTITYETISTWTLAGSSGEKYRLTFLPPAV